MLKVYITPNHFKNRKDAYSFRSQITESMSQNDMINAIADANTTVTKADTIAVMTEFQNQFDKAIKEGKSIALFMGTFSAGASGTAQTPTETFRPKTNRDKRSPVRNHKISLLFKAARKYASELRDIDFERIGKKQLCRPVIDKVWNGLEKEKTDFHSGNYLTLHGKYIKINPQDSASGVFLDNDTTGKTYRCNSYTRATRNNICAKIPDNIPNGPYHIYICTNMGDTTNILQITVKA